MKLYGSHSNKNRKDRRPTPREYYSSGYRDDVPAASGYNEYGESEEQIEAAIQSYRKKKHRRVIVVLAVILLLCVGAGAVWFIFVRPPEQEGGLNTVNPGTETSFPPVATPSPSIEPEPVSSDNWEITEEGRKTYCHTFVLAAFDQVSQNTDTIIVGMLDRRDGTLNLCNIPRDTLANIGWSNYCINTIYKECEDPDEFKDYIADILGYRVDSYAIVDMDAVAKLVDAIGGVYYNIPINMDYDDPTQDLHIHFTAGEQWLNGEDAVKFLRFRQNNDGTGYGWGDLERIEAQQDFLMTVARQLLSLGNIPNLTTVASIFEEDVITDLSAANIVWYATEALKFSADDIHFMTVPNDPSCNILLPSGENKAVISIHVDEWLEMVNTYLNPFTMEITESNVDILTFEGPNTYAGLGLFYATSGVIQSTYLNQFNQYNAGLAG